MQTSRSPINSVRQLDAVTPALAPFHAEITQAIGRLYGPSAAHDYEARGMEHWAAALRHPQVVAYGLWRDGELCALLMGLARGEAVQISLVHVLEPHRDTGAEAALADQVIRALRLPHVQHMLVEAVPFSPLQLASCMTDHGFRHIEREIMIAPLHGDELSEAAGKAVTPLDYGQIHAAAACLTAAYEAHPGKTLHYDVARPAESRAFVWRIMNGHYGRFLPGYALQLQIEGECAGVLLGAEAMPGLGFVIQVAVRPEFQGTGCGTALLRAAAEQFRQSGLSRVGLGVTRDNPAKKLYERLGFLPVQQVDAFAWWAEWP